MEDFFVAGGAALVGLAVAVGFVYFKRSLDKKALDEFCEKTGLNRLSGESGGLVQLSAVIDGKKVSYRQSVGSNHPKRTCSVSYDGSALAKIALKDGQDKRLPLLVVGRRKIGLIDLAGKAIGQELSIGSADFEKEFVVAGTSAGLAKALLQNVVTAKLLSLSGNLWCDVTIRVGSVEYNDRGYSFDGDYFKTVISILCLLADHAVAVEEDC